jgi:hypothetical protein
MVISRELRYPTISWSCRCLINQLFMYMVSYSGRPIPFTFTTLRTSNLFWNKNPENATFRSTEKFTYFSHPSSHQPPPHSVPSSTPTNGNDQETVFYVLGLWLDTWEGCSTGMVGINVACFTFPGPPCSYFRYLNENVRCHGEQYSYKHTHTHTCY